MSFRGEPSFKHGSPARVGVLLVNLGTPDAPTPAALRRYLAEFLSDPRVVEIPRLLWWLILHGVILRVRPAKSALKYAAIWTPEGSPLAVWTAKQAKLLLGYLGQAGHAVLVRHAMRYGQPSIAAELDACAPTAPPAYWCCRCTRSIRPPPAPASSTRWRPGDSARAGCRNCASCISITTTPATSTHWLRRCVRIGSAKAAARCW